MLSQQEQNNLLSQLPRHFNFVQLMRSWIDPDSNRINVKCHSIKLKTRGSIPLPLGLVTGNFDCSKMELTSLHNAPHSVWGNFDCHGNLLTSLTHGPTTVGVNSMGGGTYSCSYNFLENFQGAPQEFEGYFVGVGQLGSGLSSLDGLPPRARAVDITYQADLGLLSLVKFKQAFVREKLTGDAKWDIVDVLNKYHGASDHQVLECAVELAEMGYKNNAKF